MLLVGFVVVVGILDLIITGAVPKWAIFAPIFVPLMMKLGVVPEAVLAAYRIGDSPINAITPLNVYFGMVVGFCQRYDKDSGVGTVVAMMLPYVGALFVIWIAAAGRLVPAGAAVRAVGGGHCAPASLARSASHSGSGLIFRPASCSGVAHSGRLAFSRLSSQSDRSAAA